MKHINFCSIDNISLSDSAAIFSVRLDDLFHDSFTNEMSIHTIPANPPNPPDNKQLIADFLTKQKPKIREIMAQYLDSVFADPVGLSETPHRPEDMKIPLKPDAKLINQPLRNFSFAEDQLIKEKLNELLEKGWI